MNRHSILALLLFLFVVFSCSDDKKKAVADRKVNLKSHPKPNADSLYQFVKEQVEFGPRIPNSVAHKNAADWFVQKFESYGAEVYVQEFDANVYDGTHVKLKNIIASFNLDVKEDTTCSPLGYTSICRS